MSKGPNSKVSSGPVLEKTTVSLSLTLQDGPSLSGKAYGERWKNV